MTEIIKAIDAKNYSKINEWIDSIDQIEAIVQNWLLFAEKLSASAFSENSCDLEFARLGINLYEKIYLIDNSKESALFSSLYLRLRVIKEKKFDGENVFFSPEVIVEFIRKKFEEPIEEILDLSKRWESLEINQIRKLRSFKNWLNLLNDLEDVTDKQYDEFSEWKSLKPLLP